MASETPVGTPEGQNTLFNALANHRRRFTLYACEEADGEISLSDLANQVAAWEYNKDPEEVTADERKRVYTSLQQHHLSTLEEADLIRVDRDRIELTDRAQRIDLYLDVVTPDTIPWSLYYLAFAGISAVALALAYLDLLPPMLGIGPVAALVLVGLAASAIAHHVDTQRKRLTGTEIGRAERNDE